jgi:hypothetical protein
LVVAFPVLGEVLSDAHAAWLADLLAAQWSYRWHLLLWYSSSSCLMFFILIIQVMGLLKLVQLRNGVAIGGRRLAVREVLVQDRVWAVL